jgi:hypothetical protein
MKLRVLAACALAAVPLLARAESQEAAAVFRKWHERQSIRVDVDLTSWKNGLDAERLRKVRERMAPAQRARLGLDASDDQALAVLREIYDGFERNPEALLRFFEQHGVPGGPQSLAEERQLLSALLVHPSWIIQRLGFFAVGNRLFEHCFGPRTYASFRTLLERKAAHPLVRLLYEWIWYSLARNGWAHWHQQALSALQREAQAGKEVVYVAGGTDVLRLIEWGVYNVRVIDPMLPSQARYYSEGWEYLLKGKGPGGGLGDVIVFSRPQGLRMVRSAYREVGTFKTGRLSNGTRITLPESVTVWSFQGEGGADLGKLVFERRFARQEDFHAGPKRALAMSFNELFFVATPGADNWGIDPTRFSPETRIFVKQLRSPVAREVLLNLRAAGGSSLPPTFGSSVD